MAPGRKAKQTRRERRANFIRRLGRVLSLKRGGGKPVRKGARNVLQNGFKPAFLYGAKCLGLNDSELQTLRRGLKKAGTSGRGSTTMQLALAKLEPTMQVAAMPVRMWSNALWDSPQNSVMMKDAWQ